VVFNGFTVAEPELKVYDNAPLGTSTKDWPLQIVPLLTEMTGRAKTDTVQNADSVLVQPAELVPDTL
jgi:hypothetical protein